MTRLDLLELDEIPEKYHYPFTDDYLLGVVFGIVGAIVLGLELMV